MTEKKNLQLIQLLQSCYIGNASQIEESGTKFNVKKGSNDSILWFSIDNETNPTSTVKDDFKLDKICDYLGIFIRNESPNNTKVDNRVYICLVELKSKHHLEEGLKQLEHTFEKLKGELKKWNTPVSLILIHNGSGIENDREIQQRYKNMKDIQVRLFIENAKQNPFKPDDFFSWHA